MLGLVSSFLSPVPEGRGVLTSGQQPLRWERLPSRLCLGSVTAPAFSLFGVERARGRGGSESWVVGGRSFS